MHLVNWSGTYETVARHYYQPETVEDVERIVAACHASGQRLRPIGSGLSPNAIGFGTDSVISLALMDKVLHVDRERRQVRVQAGALVRTLATKLREEHGLSLQDYASIKDQQIGGLTQVSAHGTARLCPPNDMMVVALKIVTPAQGTLELTAADGELFELAKVGLGALGVVVEATLQCVRSHKLLVHQFVATRSEVLQRHRQWLLGHQHVKYLWVPYADSVVVFHYDPVPDEYSIPETIQQTKRYVLGPLRQLLRQLIKKHNRTLPANYLTMSSTDLRDHIIQMAPLDLDHVRALNAAEAQVWQRSTGYRVDWSDNVLGMECGGQQWVSEVCFPAGTVDEPGVSDIEAMMRVLRRVEEAGVPAPVPVEQRWTCASSSLMSPAHSRNPKDLFCWLGIVMYLPVSGQSVGHGSDASSGTSKSSAKSQIASAFAATAAAATDADADVVLARQRKAVADCFLNKYMAIQESETLNRCRARWHWAKLYLGDSLLEQHSTDLNGSDLNGSEKRIGTKIDGQREQQDHQQNLRQLEQQKRRERLEMVRRVVWARYDVEKFNALRAKWDPKGILSNDWVEAIFGKVKSE